MLRRLASWWVACALVLAQTLGAMHGVAHARVGVTGKDGATTARAAMVQAAPWTAGLFTAHDDHAGCRLFDQSTHGDALQPAPALAVAPALVAPPPAGPRRGVPGVPEPPFQARAPPLLG